MKIYKSREILDAPSGFYWVKRWKGDLPRVSWLDSHQSTEYGEGCVLNCGYREEIYVYKNDVENSDGTDGLKIYGPVEIPKF